MINYRHSITISTVEYHFSFISGYIRMPPKQIKKGNESSEKDAIMTLKSGKHTLKRRKRNTGLIWNPRRGNPSVM